MSGIASNGAVYLAYAGGLMTLVLGVVFLFSPARGLAMTQHHADKLPTIMAGRYFFMTLIAVAAAMSAKPATIALVFIGLAGVAFFDALVYARANRPVLPHLAAGIGAAVVSGVAYWGQTA